MQPAMMTGWMQNSQGDGANQKWLLSISDVTQQSAILAKGTVTCWCTPPTW